jgi:redox-sensitive bicupin YhaK (pirin superfamily)
MSNLETRPDESTVEADCPPAPTHQSVQPRLVPLGGPRGIVVRRTLPTRDRSTVGPWCFLDHFGPHALHPDDESTGMHVPPHPHIGLQTVTWLLDGEVLHRDSIGSRTVVRPGQLNLMTSGHGIAHSEHTALDGTGPLHGLQLWVALPDGARDGEAAFEHHAALPVVRRPGLRATVIMGTLAGVVSPATTYWPMVGAELDIATGADLSLPLDPEFEHAVMLLDDDGPTDSAGTDGTGARTTADGTTLDVGTLLYLGRGRHELAITSTVPVRVLLIGGRPWSDPLVMWWNFIARTHEEIVAAREDWEAGRRFGPVAGGEPRLPAPPMPATRLKPRTQTPPIDQPPPASAE